MSENQQKLKIGIISEWFTPEPYLIPESLGQFLKEQGHDVKVLTSFPNYPGGTIYPGYKQKWRMQEDVNGLNVLRVPVFPTHDSSGIKRFLTFSSFSASTSTAFRWLMDRDVIYVHASPLTVAQAGLMLKILGRKPFIIDIQDLWPDSVINSGMSGGKKVTETLEKLITQYAKFVYNKASYITAIAPTMKQKIVSLGIPEEKVSVVYNSDPMEDLIFDGLPHEMRKKLGTGKERLIVFAGNIGKMQNIDNVIRAAKILQDRKVDNVDICILGQGVDLDNIKELSKEHGVKNVKFVDRVEYTEMPEVYAASDFQLVTLKDRDVFYGTVPSKLGVSISHSAPVITAVGGDVKRLVTENKLGYAVDPENPEQLADAIEEASSLSDQEIADLRIHVKDFYNNNLAREIGHSKTEELLLKAYENK
ncbi:MAG: glycosyltransferase family 4 protein [Micrococcaceae bacterium]